MTNQTNRRLYLKILSTVMIACLFGSVQSLCAQRNKGKKETLDFNDLKWQIESDRKNLKQEPIEVTQTPELTREETEWAKREVCQLSKFNLSPKIDGRK